MNKLAEHREARNLSQRDLADMAGVSQPTIQRAEVGHKSAKLETYMKCAELLGIPLSAIFSDRSAEEERLLNAIRQIPSDRYEQVFGLLELAASSPAEEDPKT